MVNKMKANEIRSMSVADLEAKLAELKKDLFMLRMQHAQILLQAGQLLIELLGAHLTDFICLHLTHLLPRCERRSSS